VLGCSFLIRVRVRVRVRVRLLLSSARSFWTTLVAAALVTEPSNRGQVQGEVQV